MSARVQHEYIRLKLSMQEPLSSDESRATEQQEISELNLKHFIKQT